MTVAGRVLVASMTTMLMLAVLLGLGTWQVYRLHWKESILARIAEAEAAPPVPLQLDAAPFTKVVVTGRFRFDRTARFGVDVRDTLGGSTIGFYQIVPLQKRDGSVILVDRGWVPQDRGAPLDDPSGIVTVTGYIRASESPHWFSPKDDEATRQFYTLNPAKIAATLDIPDLAPFTLVALGPSTPGRYPIPAQHLPRPPNNHLSYAFTWYGLALALTVMFGIWTRQALVS